MEAIGAKKLILMDVMKFVKVLVVTTDECRLFQIRAATIGEARCSMAKLLIELRHHGHGYIRKPLIFHFAEFLIRL